MEKLVIKSGIKVWLFIGLVMIFFQIVIGGITRLTGSGLSITKWEIVTGSIPPLTESKWQSEFDLYKRTPQYQKINTGMSIGAFKWIYFWEYLHRLWARSMGFVFLIPFFYFLYKGWISVRLRRQLITVVLLAGVVGVFGWIMVSSGLVNRPWVNAYKLSMHLGLALITLSYLWWVYLDYTNSSKSLHFPGSVTAAKWFLILVAIQILMGGMMSGMKAALIYPTFPKMGSNWIDPIIFQTDSWQWKHFVDYDNFPFLPALVQLFHRITAFVILGYFMVIISRVKWRGIYLLIGLTLLLQITLGICTLILSKGKIPVGFGVFHQMVGILLLIWSIKWLFYEKISVKI
ncbi:MAG: COX15/CtaA family protein [Saprospiraceae bacterium]